MIRATPHYLTTPYGQMRFWVAGTGRPVLALPGLVRAAETVAIEIAELGLTAHVLELIGAVAIADLPQAIGFAARCLDLEEAAIAYDLSAVLLPGSIALHASTAANWRASGLRPPDITPRPDGTHLTALHAHLRNAHILDPLEPSRAAPKGAALPDPDALNAALLASAAKPQAYAELWSACLEAAGGLAGPATLAEAVALLAARPGPTKVLIPTVAPTAGIWQDHADLPRGRMHLRRAGKAGIPLIALHSAPGGSAPLVPLIEGLSLRHQVFAPDFLGNGLSAKPDGLVDIARLARDIVDLLDVLDLAQVDLWGTHTGAVIALETALIAPDRVRRLVLEAPPLLSASFTEDILEHYLPAILPDCWGLHLQQAWNMRRDMFLFWPWYRRERAAVRPLQLPDADFLHDWTIGLLTSGRTYDRSYRAAFEYDTRARLPRLSRPALVCAGPSDMLADGLDEAGRLSSQVTVRATPATVWYPHQSPEAIAQTLAIYADFLEL